MFTMEMGPKPSFMNVRCYFTSIHEAPWYPGTGLVTDTGSGAGVGTNLNLPLAAGADDASLNLWLEKVRPAWEAFEPEILPSAGFDGDRRDPCQSRYTPAGFERLTSHIVQWSKAAGNPVSFQSSRVDIIVKPSPKTFPSI